MITIKHFTASWCEPCKKINPIIDEILSEYSNINQIIIDIDENPEDSYKFGIRGLPTIIFEKDDTEIDRVVGINKKSYYTKILDNNLDKI